TSEGRTTSSSRSPPRRDPGAETTGPGEVAAVTVFGVFLGVHSVREVGQVVADGVVNGSAYALLGIAWSLIYGVARRFHFALAFTYALAPFIASVLTANSGLPIVPAILAGLAGAVLFGV